MKVTPRTSDKVIEDYIRKNYKIGDKITMVEIKKNLGIRRNPITNTFKWLLNLGKIRTLDIGEWKKNPVKKQKVKTFEVIGEI